MNHNLPAPMPTTEKNSSASFGFAVFHISALFPHPNAAPEDETMFTALNNNQQY